MDDTTKQSYPDIHLAHCALIVLVSVCIYWNSIPGDFIWDDRGLILDNMTYLDDMKNLLRGFYKPFFSETPYYRPLLTASFIIDYQLWGTNPFGYHVTNVMMHIVNALLAYLFVYLLLKQRNLALITSLLFAVHPVQSEAVAWISGRNDLMLTFFALICVILHLRRNEYRGWRSVFARSCFHLAYVAALLTKESGMILPLLFMLVDYLYPHRDSNIIRDYAGVVLISIGYICTKTIVIGDAGMGLGGGGLADTTVRVFATYAYYLKLLLFPVFQSAVPHIHKGGLGGIWIISSFTVMTCALALTIIFLYRMKEISFALLWVLVSLIPVCGIVPLSLPALEHRLYLGSVGFSMLIPCALYRISFQQHHARHSIRRTACVPLVIAAVLVLYATKTMTRNAIWGNELSFWQSTVQASPGSTVARNNLGIVCARSGNHQMAIREFETALALSGGNDDSIGGQDTIQRGKLLNNLGKSYYQLLRKLVADDRHVLPEAATDRSDDERENATQKLYALSYTCYTRALEFNHARAEAHNNLGDLFYLMKNYPAAEEEYREALKSRPDDAEYRNNLALVYYDMRDYDEAEEQLNRAITLRPDFLEARNNLALVYMHRGKHAHALDELKEILSYSPDNSAVWLNIALVYLRGFNDSERAAYYLKEGLKVTSYSAPVEMLRGMLSDLKRDGEPLNLE